MSQGRLPDSKAGGMPGVIEGASPYNIQFSAESSPGDFHVEGLNKDSADKVSELLMLNHENYHNIFHMSGLHNHIVHHLCTLWALGASPAEIQVAYDLNKTFQLPRHGNEASVVSKLKEDTRFFNDCLGEPEFYNDFLQFFQEELAERGVEEVVKEYLFSGDERAEDMLGRMHAGLLHPLLHLGFGLEFNQPCIVAEALASAAIHETEPIPWAAIETHIATHPTLPHLTYLQPLSALHTNPTIRTAVRPSDNENAPIPPPSSTAPPTPSPPSSHNGACNPPTPASASASPKWCTTPCTWLPRRRSRARSRASISSCCTAPP